MEQSQRHYPLCFTNRGDDILPRKDSSTAEKRTTFTIILPEPSVSVFDVDTKESSPMAVDLIYCHGFALFNVASTIFIE
jgi:hypothetical protein